MRYEYYDTDTSLMDIEEEKRLGMILLNNNIDSLEFINARNRLVEANMRLVFRIALRLAKTKSIDAIQDGNMGLIKAATYFDYRKGRFSTYASCYIKNAIIDGFNKNKFIHIPQKIKADINKILSYERNYLMNYGQAPTEENIAKDLKISVDYINFIKILPNCIILFNDDECDMPIEINENIFPHVDDLMILDDREKLIIKKYYGIDEEEKSFKEIANLMNLSSEGVRQIHNRAIKKLKENLHAI